MNLPCDISGARLFRALEHLRYAARKTLRRRENSNRKEPSIMQSFHAPSVHDLLRILGEVPIPERPPPREKRKTEYTEKWVIRYFFEAIAETGLLEYPLCVEHRDKPDVVLSSRIGKTGIEITEAVPKDRAKVEAWLGNTGNREMVPENWSELGRVNTNVMIRL